MSSFLQKSGRYNNLYDKYRGEQRENQREEKRMSCEKIRKLREKMPIASSTAECIHTTERRLSFLLDNAKSDAELESNKELIEGIEAMRGALSRAELLHIIIESILARG